MCARRVDDFGVGEEFGVKLHVIPVPHGWSVEQSWEAISRGVLLTDPEPLWAVIETDQWDRFIRWLPNFEGLDESDGTLL